MEDISNSQFAAAVRKMGFEPSDSGVVAYHPEAPGVGFSSRPCRHDKYPNREALSRLRRWLRLLRADRARDAARYQTI